MLLLYRPLGLGGEVGIVGRFCGLIGVQGYSNTEGATNWCFQIFSLVSDLERWLLFWVDASGTGKTAVNVVSKRNQSTVSGVRGTELGGPRCTSVNAWPHCLLRHCLRGQGSSCKTIIAIYMLSCSACPVVSRTCGGLGGFILCYSMLWLSILHD